MYRLHETNLTMTGTSSIQKQTQHKIVAKPPDLKVGPKVKRYYQGALL